MGNFGYPQEFKYEEKLVTGIFEAQGKSKSEIFSAINKWISINYNSSKNVIQMNDMDSGTIIQNCIKNHFKAIGHSFINVSLTYLIGLEVDELKV